MREIMANSCSCQNPGQMPANEVIIRGEKYRYAGNIPSGKMHRNTNREFNRENGKKTAFRKDPGHGLAMYISVKTFDKLLKKYGKGY